MTNARIEDSILEALATEPSKKTTFRIPTIEQISKSAFRGGVQPGGLIVMGRLVCNPKAQLFERLMTEKILHREFYDKLLSNTNKGSKP